MQVNPGMILRRSVLVAALLAAFGGLSSLQAQSLVESVDTGDREVVLSWNPTVGDTFTAEERVDVPLLVYRVPNALGIARSQFRTRVSVQGRGAAVRDGTAYGVRVGNPGDFYITGQGTPPPPAATFEVTGAFQFGADRVAVAFSQDVDAAAATNPANYAFTPALNIASATLQENGKTVIMQTASPLPTATPYTVTVSGVTNTSGQSPVSTGPFAFTTSASAVLNISDLYANPASFTGQSVTVVGQVYVPLSAPGPQGFIQDGTGRGLRLFGGSVAPPVDALGRVVEVTGTVGSSLNVLTLTGYSAAMVTENQPHLGARVLPLRSTDNDGLLGSYIESQGLISGIDSNSDPEQVFYSTTVIDTLFAGYRVWRALAVDLDEPGAFVLLRNYSLFDSTWTMVGDIRSFSDPDSIVKRGTERDTDAPEEIPGPFNGVGYVYSVTAFDAAIDATAFPIRVATFERQAPRDVVHPETIFPNKDARLVSPLLGDVKVVPNPYNPAARFDRQAFPGPPRVQFINMPRAGRVDIYTVAGDHVRTLVKADDPGEGAVTWDLKNDNGSDVSSGIYIFYVTHAGETATGRFVVAR